MRRGEINWLIVTLVSALILASILLYLLAKGGSNAGGLVKGLFGLLG